ncbi:MAG: hypothetical protein EHM41_03740 [Chloroflexi bacterium]|nr:MAG: hypothetical protein EHM41_03740 [Chloroflexota bacterium]
MAERSVRLVYPPTLINVPVIHQLIRRYDVTVNLLGAEIDSQHGWVELQLSGDESIIDEAFTWLKTLGIEIHDTERNYGGSE